MEIAKGINNKDYFKLNLLDYDSDDWSVAFEYLEKRLTERFVEPADQLIKLEDNVKAIDKKYGFSILALDCLLLETIQSFYEGVLDSSGKSKSLFVHFLLNRTSFKEHFKSKKDAISFYKDFRCGILHQGQTSIEAKVWSVGNLIWRTKDYVIVNGQLFHKNIKNELSEYINALRKKNDKTLMENFKAKMDFIAGK